MALRSTDQMLARLVSEIEERQQFIDGVVEAAQDGNGDLEADKLELVTRARNRIEELSKQMAPLEEARRISTDSADRIAAIAKFMNQPERPREVEYRSAGHYIIDRWQASLGGADAAQRLQVYEQRVAAHQTTADNLGVVPEPIVGDVLNFIDSSRPVVTVLGPRAVPGGRFNRPRVTQHTDVAAQSAEKAELVSQKMLIVRVPVTMGTYGGYVNVSRQDIDWTTPAIMDIVVNDLAAQYAKETETATVTELQGAAVTGPTIPTGTPTPEDVAGAIWSAAGTAWTTMQGAGTVFLAVPPGMLGMLGPLFGQIPAPGVQGGGFSAARYTSGAVGVVSGIPVYMSPAVAANTLLLINSAASEVYEQRIGSLQVTEPSVLGVQVAYAGYFSPVVMEAGGIVEITKTP